MNDKLKLAAAVSLASAALLLGACGLAQPPAYRPTAAPGYGYGPGMMGGGHMGGMMGGYGQYAPAAQPTPFGATPIPVDREIQITALYSRFSPAEIVVESGESVRFVVTNGDPYLHNFVGEEAGIPFLNLPGGATQTATWAAPAEGVYIAACTLHQGMRLTVVVEGL